MSENNPGETPPTFEISKFGRVALEKKYITMPQLQECLKIQLNYERMGREVPKLGTILLAKKHLTPEQIKDILSEQTNAKTADPNMTRKFRAGEIIFAENQSDHHDLYLLRSGTIEIWKQHILLEERQGAGTFFGVSGFLLKSPRTATIKAKIDCEVLQILASNADDFFKAKPEMLLRLTKSLAQSFFQLRNSYISSRQLTIAAKQNVEKTPTEKPAVVAVKPPTSTAIVAQPPMPLAKTVAEKTPTPPAIIEKPKTPIPPTEKIAAEKIAPIATPPAKTELPKPTVTPVIVAPTPPKVVAEKPAVAPIVSIAPVAPVAPKTPPPKIADEKIAAEKPVEEKITPTEKTAEVSADSAPTPNAENSSATGVEKLYAEIEQLKPAPFSKDVRNLIKNRIDLYLQIEKLEEERVALEKSLGTVSERVKSELIRQRREYIKIPPRDTLQMSLDKMEERLSGVTPTATPPAEETPAAEKVEEIAAPEVAAKDVKAAKVDPNDESAAQAEKGKQALGELAALDFLDPSDFVSDDEDDGLPPEPEPELEASATTPQLENDVRAAYEIAVKQKKILLERYSATEKTLFTCAEECNHEPLFLIIKKLGLEPRLIFGWGILTFCLKEYAEAQNARLKEVRKEIAAAADAEKNKKSGGFLGMGKKVDTEAEKKRLALEAEEKQCKFIAINVNRDLNSNEPEMVNIFWTMYEQLAQKYVAGKIAGVDERSAIFLRAYLRWGALGSSERWLSSLQMKTIIGDCYAPSIEPQNTLTSTNLYYADEIILFTANGKLPPSPNEDLELNHRNSKEWRADRAWRRTVNCQSYVVALNELLKEQTAKAKTAREQIIEFDKMIEKTKASNRGDKKKLIVEFKDKSQDAKVKAARCEKIAERISQELLPKNADEMENCKQALTESGIEILPANLADHEIKCLRRNSRLVARLKEPFLPMALRDRFKPDINCVSTRVTALEQLVDVEKRDPTIFLEPIVPNAKKQHQVFMRRTPIIALAPAGGVLGFIMGPRNGIESGRFIIPSYVERANMREDILWCALSDFRYDTSKTSAGVDVMTSDTLVAAYANVRWNLRKRDRELRQKAGIYTEENERTNFRRHYMLYMKSAPDAGKLLFFKCPELYELIINKFIDLPQGCEILKR